MGRPEEIAAALFPAWDESSCVKGVELFADGGAAQVKGRFYSSEPWAALGAPAGARTWTVLALTNSRMPWAPPSRPTLSS